MRTGWFLQVPRSRYLLRKPLERHGERLLRQLPLPVLHRPFLWGQGENRLVGGGPQQPMDPCGRVAVADMATDQLCGFLQCVSADSQSAQPRYRVVIIDAVTNQGVGQVSPWLHPLQAAPG